MSDITQRFHHHNPESAQASKSLKGQKDKLRLLVLSFIASRGSVGATCDECEAILEMSHQTTSARITELKQKNLIKKVGTRKTRSGRNAAIYTVSTEPFMQQRSTGLPHPLTRPTFGDSEQIRSIKKGLL